MITQVIQKTKALKPDLELQDSNDASETETCVTMEADTKV